MSSVGISDVFSIDISVNISYAETISMASVDISSAVSAIFGFSVVMFSVVSGNVTS